MTVKLLTEHHLEFLSFKGGCTGSFESMLIKLPHCWKSHVPAHLCILLPPQIPKNNPDTASQRHWWTPHGNTVKKIQGFFFRLLVFIQWQNQKRLTRNPPWDKNFIFMEYFSKNQEKLINYQVKLTNRTLLVNLNPLSRNTGSTPVIAEFFLYVLSHVIIHD